jgi:hypothetical protein
VVTDDDAYNETGYKSHLHALEAAGIPVILDNRSSLMHNKLVVSDAGVLAPVRRLTVELDRRINPKREAACVWR